MISILTDVTKCIGCHKCVEACVEEYRLGPGIPRLQDSPDGLSAQRWTSVLERPGGHYIRKHCQHCLEPACVSACPVGAMYKTPEGPVIYDSNKCLGCRYCMMACPYGIPRYEWDATVPRVRKCVLCYDRVKQGQLPSCVEACPVQATIFGDRDALLAEAHQRLGAEPTKYLQKIYGEHEVGGTSVLYISDVPLESLGYRGDPGQTPLPDLTWVALSNVPPVIIGVSAFMVGLYWVIQRRMKLMGAPEGAESMEQKHEHDS